MLTLFVCSYSGGGVEDIRKRDFYAQNSSTVFNLVIYRLNVRAVLRFNPKCNQDSYKNLKVTSSLIKRMGEASSQQVSGAQWECHLHLGWDSCSLSETTW